MVLVDIGFSRCVREAGSLFVPYSERQLEGDLDDTVTARRDASNLNQDAALIGSCASELRRVQIQIRSCDEGIEMGRLNASPRSSIVRFSPMAKVRDSAMLSWIKPGPRTVPYRMVP